MLLADLRRGTVIIANFFEKESIACQTEEIFFFVKRPSHPGSTIALLLGKSAFALAAQAALP
jgi:hypothetical protein